MPARQINRTAAQVLFFPTAFPSLACLVRGQMLHVNLGIVSHCEYDDVGLSFPRPTKSNYRYGQIHYFHIIIRPTCNCILFISRPSFGIVHCGSGIIQMRLLVGKSTQLVYILLPLQLYIYIYSCTLLKCDVERIKQN